MKQITPCLWFDGRAEEAMNHYVSIFANSRTGEISLYGPDSPGVEGTVMAASFSLNGQQFTALNGGPLFQFTPAISLAVNCDTQEEMDHLWERLSEGGATSQCGWLTDKFGVSWQIVPTELGDLMADPDPVRAGRAMQAMLRMTKLDIGALRRALNGE